MVEHVIRNDGVVGSSPISGTSAPIGGAGVFGLGAEFACDFGCAIQFDPSGHDVGAMRDGASLIATSFRRSAACRR